MKENDFKYAVLICVSSLLLTGSMAMAQGDALSTAISKTQQIKISQSYQQKSLADKKKGISAVTEQGTVFLNIRKETALYVKDLSNEQIAEIIKSLGATRSFIETENLEGFSRQDRNQIAADAAVRTALQSQQNRNIANKKVITALLNISQ